MGSMDFFEQLKGQYNQFSTLHIILDGAGYHRSEEVKQRVMTKQRAKKLNIQLHYLPLYIPIWTR